MKKPHTIGHNGHLLIGGCDAAGLRKKYGTPLYVIDKDVVEKSCQLFTQTLASVYPNSLVCYASKALCNIGVYQIVQAQGLGADVVSLAELMTALYAKMPADKLYFHGNNKSREELEMAVSEGVNIVVDSVYELELLAKIGRKARLMVRCNPNVQPHTHAAVVTGAKDSKFGFSIESGEAAMIARQIASNPLFEFIGVHCHIGSQILEPQPFVDAALAMCDFASSLILSGISVPQINLGGGFGIDYNDELDEDALTVSALTAIAETLKACLPPAHLPKLVIEPARSIIAKAGVTLYTVGSIRQIEGVRNYVSVDGGMFESPRYALYQSDYQVVLATNLIAPRMMTATIVGKCCESGDIIAKDKLLPLLQPGDLLAVLYTGAYNYSMASNYNRNLVPPVVLTSAGKSCYLVRPQTPDDIISRDCEVDLN